MSIEEKKNKIISLHPNLRLISIDKKFVEVQNEFGICKVQHSSLLEGSKPSISTAINQNEYFKNQVRRKLPDLEIIGNYNGIHTKVLVKNKYGICNCLANNLIIGQVPCIRSAVNKTEYFINMAIEKHGNRYDYSKSKYISNSKKITIICKEHGEFYQFPNGHLSSSGCRKCADKNKLGWWYKNPNNKDKYSCFYILNISNEDENFMKFGVTVDLKRRIRDIINQTKKKYNIKIIKIIEGTVEYCRILEKKAKYRIMKSNVKYKPSIKFCGKNECYKSKIK